MAEYIGCDRVHFRQPIAERHYEVLRKNGRGQRTKPASPVRNEGDIHPERAA
ncbi:hypothetical protein QFZ96_005262 [Paraburkholderia youngii]